MHAVRSIVMSMSRKNAIWSCERSPFIYYNHADGVALTVMH